MSEFGEDTRWHYVGALLWRLNLQVYKAEVTDRGGWYVAQVFGPPKGGDLATKRHTSFLEAKAWAEEWIKAAEVEMRLLLASDEQEVEF